MSRTLLSLAGFQVILIGRFWVIAEADRPRPASYQCSLCTSDVTERGQRGRQQILVEYHRFDLLSLTHGSLSGAHFACTQ
jgi:hypothetical protein